MFFFVWKTQDIVSDYSENCVSPWIDSVLFLNKDNIFKTVWLDNMNNNFFWRSQTVMSLVDELGL
jgi:hypothetical protein